MVTKQIILNTCSVNKVIVYANSGEVDSRYIKVAFKDAGRNNIDLTDRSVIFYAKKPDGTTIFNYCTTDTTDNTAIAELTSQALSVPGILECEFQIFDGNNVLLKVNGLKVLVSKGEDFSEAVESTSESNVLISMINSIGVLSDLSTTKKDSVVEAINEVNEKIIPVSQGGTGATTLSGARTNLEVLKAYILYDNDLGNTGTVTLSDTFNNYVFVDIIVWDYYISRVYNRGIRPVGIMKIGGYGGDYLEWYSESLVVSDAIITRNGVTYGKILSNGTVQISNTDQSSHHVPIRSVIGYKY